MKIKNGFELRDICGEKVVLAQGLENLDFSKMINLNETAAYLWDNVVGKDFAEADLVALLLKEYDVAEEQAADDVHAMVTQWRELGLIAD